MAKTKLASHEFRISTDQVRQDYRRRRATELEPQLTRRRALAAEIATEASAHIPRDAGYLVCPPGTLDGVPAITQAARDIVAHVDPDEQQRKTLEQQQKKKANKPFMVMLLDMESLTLDSPFIRFGLRRDIVATAAAYLGVVPILDYVNVMHSSHVADEPIKSQLYHCDSDEVEQVKVFIVCEPVTAETGPLTFLSAAQSQVVRDRVGYMYDSKLTDQAVSDVLGSSVHETALVGEPGTTAFLDTSRCFHYGSRVTDTSAHRLVVMLQYVTPLAFVYPENPLEGARFRRLAHPSQDELTSMVLGGV